MKTIIRITTIPLSLDKLLEGQLRFMSQYFKVIGVSSEKEYLEKIGKRENVETFHIEMTRQITPIKDVIAVLKLYNFLIKIKPFIVHSHTPKAGIVGMLASKLANVPNRLHTVAGLPLLEATGTKRKLLNFVEKLTYSCATKVYPNSFDLKNIILQENFTKNKKLKVIGNGSSNGIDTNYFNPILFSENQNQSLKDKLEINSSDFVFIFVGRIVADKGINELIKAFQALSKFNKRLKLILVGNQEEALDPLLSDTKNAITTNPTIISVGYQNDVRPYFTLSNCLVFPSYREGFPNVVMQAGAMGLPSIVSDINGCNEIIIDGENGLIIPPKNEEAIYSAMQKITQNKQLVFDLSQNARQLITSRYNQQLVWNAILEEYRTFEK